jgi:hypothetical protein
MKRYFILLSFSFLFIIVDGQVNLGTVYFQNPQYLVSFDKVMYPGYKISLENFTVREYLMNTKISEKVLAKKIEESYSEGMGFFLEDQMIENWILMVNIKLNEKFEISEETYNLTQADNELQLPSILSKTTVFKRASGKQVEEVQIETAINMETNTISSLENILNTRPMGPDEVADTNGNVYRTVNIGGQRWMAENLRSTNFSNGDAIPFLNDSQWGNTASSGLVRLNPEGNYYNFYSFIDERNVCPAGFHTPVTSDIENLYNYITPYGGKTKIAFNKVKKKVFPSVLTPIIAPISAAANAVLYSTSVAVDLAYTIPWVVIDGLILGPIFGWETVKEQKQKLYERALKFSNYIDTNGRSVKIDAAKLTYNDYYDKSLPVPPVFWNKFTMVKLIDGVKVEINDANEIQKYKYKATENKYKLKYTPFPTAQDNIAFFATEAVADGVGLIPILPYREVNGNTYPRTKFNLTIETLSFKNDYQPVLTFLLEKGKEEVLSDPFGFSLNFNNQTKFPYGMKGLDNIVGLTYDDGEVPQVWGLGRKMSRHELRSFWIKDENQDAKKMATRIRCVAD